MTATPEQAPPTGRQAAWNYLVFGLSKTSTLIMMAVVARLLTPSDFGQFVLALLIVNFFDYVKDLGVGAALVQSPLNWNRLAPTGLTLSVGFGIAIGLIVAAVAPSATALLDRPELTPLIQVLAIGLVIVALSAIPAARLRRNLDFRKRIWPEFISAAGKAVLTVALAAGGLGVWSLVYGQLAGAVALTLLYWRVSRTHVKFGFDRLLARDLLRYGIPLSGSTMLGFVIYNIDYLAIGIRLGDEQLGLYTIAYRLPELLVLSLCIVISEVLFSSLSRLQHDPVQFAQHYLGVVRVVTALTAPISVVLAAAAPAVIDTLYGPGYADAGTVLAVLSVYTLIASASWHIGDVFKALGRPSLLVGIAVGKLVVMIGPIWWAAGHSIVMVALVLLIVESVNLVVRVVIVRTTAELALGDLAKALLLPIPAAACMWPIVIAAEHATAQWPAALTLLIATMAGLLTYAAGLRLTAPDLYFAALDVVRSVLHRGESTAMSEKPPAMPSTAQCKVGRLPNSEGESL